MKRSLLSVAVQVAMMRGAVTDLRTYTTVQPLSPVENRTRDKSQARAARRAQIKRNGGKR